MIAVVKIAGQQYKVEKDQTLYVPHIEGNAGDKVDLEVLMADADGTVSLGTDIKAKVKAEILEHVKGDKVIVFKKKRRKDYTRKNGHRQQFTKVMIEEISK
jgi:large subunit ribosomal protein L21